jgi:hypothetical protein
MHAGANELDCDVTAQGPQLLGDPHLAHPTLADLLQELVQVERRGVVRSVVLSRRVRQQFGQEEVGARPPARRENLLDFPPQLGVRGADLLEKRGARGWIQRQRLRQDPVAPLI